MQPKEEANLTATINKKVFYEMSLYALENGMKKREIVELALIQYLKKHKGGDK
ncbi:hypothetical protein [Halobacillus naozhouensis]|uniref:CopG family transcriptional regulator n=1 Tax=Halobacillus naozhouensis TaxID=554880 RepID=A0ABY8J404_9BACI|nr:hypothetical protein [Halobacillus naozhouensis]WFT77110.1 hypothetical protein P9989_21500 [Halobacillus naozhouensis]